MTNYKPTRPTLAFYHANCRVTGSAAKFELHPAHDSEEGSILLVMANQATCTPQTPVPCFDWENAITAKLGFADICKMLQVLRGETESIDDGRGLFHATVTATTKIALRHIIEPVQAYSLEVYSCERGGGNGVSSHILLTSAEALGLFMALENVMGLIAFGCNAPTVA